jgi:hypothetical protein
MFQFPTLASHLLLYSQKDHYHLHDKGLPHSEISGSKVDYHLPEAYRRLTASFIASYCQGIHRVPLIALS